jgi:Heavy metal binding domain
MTAPRSSPGWIVILRIGLLALAGTIVAVALVAARRHGQAARRPAGANAAFVCPMHAEVSADRAGECPICGMALVGAGTVVRENEDAVAAAQLLSNAVGGLASNLVGYYPSPVRQHVLRYEIYAPAWVERDNLVVAQLYGDQLPTLDPNERGSFSPGFAVSDALTRDVGADGAAAREVRVAGTPPQPWDRSTSLVAFAAEPGASPLRAGTVGWVKFARRPRQMLVVPAGAVLQDRDGPYVLVFSRVDGVARRRAIEVGRITTGVAAVLSGLDARELVVSVNAFFWDAERRLQGERARARLASDANGSPR